MKTCKVFVPIGALGTGITKEDFDRGVALRPDIICCDAGSTDSGPYYLGTGSSKYAREAVKEDLRLMILAGKTYSIPVAVGTSGTCGVNASVDELEEICLEICREENIQVKIAKVYTEQGPEILKKKYMENKIHPLAAAPDITERVFDECTHIVALAGAEPFITALEAGVDIVLCGRATDTAIIAAMPLMKGCDIAASWHGAKIAECGALCTTNPNKGGVFLIFDESSFTIEATSEDSRCSIYSVSAHMLYENADPYRLREPSGTLDTTNSIYTQVDEKRVRVTGTKFEHAEQYTMKLEGSGPIGFQTITLIGIQDKRIMKNPMTWIDSLRDYVSAQLKELHIPYDHYSFALKPYGWNAVTEGVVPEDYIPNEIGLLLVVNAKSQELATKVAKVFNPKLLHFPVIQNEQLPTYAFPFSPAEIERGQVYEFKLNHVVEVEHPLELIQIEFVDSMTKV
jgi:hypothetical protein